jgi:hypothetical protein
MAWTANTAIGAAPEQVIDVLTRPCAIASWAPVPFEVEGVTGDRLEAGSRARVAGRLAGKELEFEVHVHEADCCNFKLTAIGPFVEMDVVYDIAGLDEWSEVNASIDVRGNGILGRFVAKALEGFLASGALNTALGQLAEAAENPDLTHAALAA